jgi:hypothetical protein
MIVTQSTPNFNYYIIAYPLDAIVSVPPLYLSEFNDKGQAWSYDKSEAIIFPEYMAGFSTLMQIKRKNKIFLITLHNEHQTK